MKYWKKKRTLSRKSAEVKIEYRCMCTYNHLSCHPVFIGIPDLSQSLPAPNANVSPLLSVSCVTSIPLCTGWPAAQLLAAARGSNPRPRSRHRWRRRSARWRNTTRAATRLHRESCTRASEHATTKLSGSVLIASTDWCMPTTHQTPATNICGRLRSFCPAFFPSARPYPLSLLNPPPKKTAAVSQSLLHAG